MAERMVLGVDFSGAKGDDHVGKTWVTKGRFDGGTLKIHDCHPVSRDGLRTLLKDLPSDSVAAMDFPFGIPTEFIQYLGIDATDMPTVWRSISSDGKDVAWFEAKCREAVKELGYQPKRTGDKYYPESISPLNLRMLRMTFHGMSMLDKLWNETNCQVPPLQQEGRNGITLLEVMPGATLKAFSLPHTEYKNKDRNPLENLKNRQKILAMLSGSFTVDLSNLADFRDIYIFSDDALDSLVAAMCAAKWARGDKFKQPNADEIAAAKLEGWIYVPEE